MTFTDDDLKRLKENDNNRRNLNLSREAAHALLARLEAAEDAMLDAMLEHPGLKKKISYIRWREVTGK